MSSNKIHEIPKHKSNKGVERDINYENPRKPIGKHKRRSNKWKDIQCLVREYSLAWRRKLSPQKSTNLMDFSWNLNCCVFLCVKMLERVYLVLYSIPPTYKRTCCNFTGHWNCKHLRKRGMSTSVTCEWFRTATEAQHFEQSWTRQWVVLGMEQGGIFFNISNS